MRLLPSKNGWFLISPNPSRAAFSKMVGYAKGLKGRVHSGIQQAFIPDAMAPSKCFDQVRVQVQDVLFSEPFHFASSS